MGENSELEYVRSSETRSISVSICCCHQNGWREAEYGVQWRRFFFFEKMVIDEPASFLDHVHLGRTQRECKPNETIIWTAHEDVWVTYFSWSNRKITVMAENSRTNSSVVLRHGGTRSQMCWTIPWIGKEDSGAISQSFASLFGLSAIQTGGSWISWRVVRSLLANWSTCLVGTNWTSWLLLVSAQVCKTSHKRLARLISYIHHTNDKRQ